MRHYSKDTYLSVSITPLSDRAQNYRPVSNLTFTSKIVERLVCLQLVDFLECTLLLPSLQSAYRKNHSTETAVLKVITDVLRAADRGEVTLLCLLDYLRHLTLWTTTFRLLVCRCRLVSMERLCRGLSHFYVAVHSPSVSLESHQTACP